SSSCGSWPASTTHPGRAVSATATTSSAPGPSFTPKPLPANRASRARASAAAAADRNPASSTPRAPARQAAIARDGSPAAGGVSTITSVDSITLLVRRWTSLSGWDDYGGGTVGTATQSELLVSKFGRVLAIWAT